MKNINIELLEIKQAIFDCAMELQYHRENKSDKELSNKLLKSLSLLDEVTNGK